MLLALLLVLNQSENAPAQAASDALKFDYFRVKDRVEADGAVRRSIEVSVFLRTPTAVSGFGQLAAPYVNGYGDVQFNQVRVSKADGSSRSVNDGVLEDLNPFGVNDSSIPVDIRLKKLTIPRLEPGDRLSYTMVVTQRPFIPGEFYGEMKFNPVPVEGPQVYELDIPADSRLNVHLRPDVGASWEVVPAEKNRLVRRLSASVPVFVVGKTGITEAQREALQVPDVAYTTFANWSAVANWWWKMSEARVRGDETTKKEAERLVAGKATPREKLEAIASFVGSTIRYLNVSFGAGRMQPRAAPSVLASRFGDCKDKVALVMAMAEAVGLDVRPVIISATRSELQDTTPGPQQFDHAIAVARLGSSEKDWVWIDATVALSPPLILAPALRDKRALLIERNGNGVLVRTPALPDRPRRRSIDLKGTLDPSGVLKGQIRIVDATDAEAYTRGAFGSAPVEQRVELVRSFLPSTWKDARLSNVRISDASDLGVPFSFDLDFERDVTGIDSEREWKFWVPDFGETFPEANGDETAKKPLAFFMSDWSFHAQITLPENVTARAPLSISLDRPFASLASKYGVDGRVLNLERVIRLPQAALTRDQLPAYVALRKAAETDRTQDFTLGPIKSATPAAAVLQKEGNAARKAKDYAKAVDALRRASESDPKLKGVFQDLGLALRDQDKHSEAIAAFSKAIEADPYSDRSYSDRAYSLFELDRDEEAERDLLKQIEAAPFEEWSYRRLAAVRRDAKRFGEAAALYAKTVTIDASDADDWVELGWAHARDSKPDEARKAFAKAQEIGLKAGQKTYVAGGLHFLGDIKEAGALAEADLADVSKNVALITPSNMTEGYLFWNRRRSQAWELIGAAALASKDLAKAEAYLTAAWDGGLLPRAAYSLAALREKQGRAEAAAEFLEVADRLGEWDRPADFDVRLVAAKKKGPPDGGTVEIARVRYVTVGSPDIDINESVLVLLSNHKIEAIKNLSKRRETEAAKQINRFVGLKMTTPSPGPEPMKYLRRGVLNCDRGVLCAIAFDLPGTLPPLGASGTISISKMSPKDGAVLKPGEVVRLNVAIDYDLNNGAAGTIILVVGSDPRRPLVSPPPTRTVNAGKGTVNFEVEFKVPVDAKDVRVFVPLMVDHEPTKTVTGARFTVKP